MEKGSSFRLILRLRSRILSIGESFSRKASPAGGSILLTEYAVVSLKQPVNNESEMNLMEEIPNRLISTLPILPRNILSRQNSSYHRSGINKDMGNFLYIDEKGEAVLFDAYGPGRVLSIFSTKLLEETSIHFYFDGSKTARYSLPIQEFYSGTHPHFPAPMVSYKILGYYLGDDSKGGNCLLPIPFQESLKITITGEPDIFYHILWEQYPHGTAVPGFPDLEAQREAAALWAYTGNQVVSSLGKTISFDLEPGKKESFFKDHDSACITSLQIETAWDESRLQDLYLCIRWDDHLYDSVHVPLDHFFAIPSGLVEIETPLLTVKKLESGCVRLISRWPMPYWKEASLSLQNMGAETISNVQARVETVDQPYASEGCGYFSAHFHAGGTEYGKDWTLLHSRGWGKYVGTIQQMLGEHYCEGDEHFYLDGASTPQINGTGTEDYYLFCFWPSPLYCTPYHGSTVDVFQQGGGIYANAYQHPSAYYRFHLDGPIAFYAGIDARIQHGAMSHIHSQYASTAITYQQKNPVLELSDFLDVGNPEARDMHAYQAEQAGFSTVESSFIGNDIEVRQRLTGFEHAGGEIQFQVNIHPQNRGVMLRRRIDQAHGRQKAAVYVDGQYAGTWYEANENTIHRWHDSDFLIPPDLCRDKKKLLVQLCISRCAESLFTDFNYAVYSFVEPAPALFPRRQAILGEWIDQVD